MGSSVQRNPRDVQRLGISSDSTTQSYSNVNTFRAEVSHDGNEAVLHVSGDDGNGRYKVVVSYSMMGIVSHEIRHAAMTMVHRQRLQLDMGIDAMLELCATALRPTSIEFIADPTTGEQLVVIQFEENSPLVLRMSFEMILATLQKLQVSLSQSKN